MTLKTHSDYSKIGTLINVGAGEDYKLPIGKWKHQKDNRISSKYNINSLYAVIPNDDILIIDVDVKSEIKPHKRGEEGLKALEEYLGIKLVPHVQTQSGGYHIYVRVHSSIHKILSLINSQLAKKFVDIDFQNNQRYVVCGGQKLPNDKEYKQLRELDVLEGLEGSLSYLANELLENTPKPSKTSKTANKGVYSIANLKSLLETGEERKNSFKIEGFKGSWSIFKGQDNNRLLIKNLSDGGEVVTLNKFLEKHGQEVLTEKIKEDLSPKIPEFHHDKLMPPLREDVIFNSLQLSHILGKETYLESGYIASTNVKGRIRNALVLSEKEAFSDKKQIRSLRYKREGVGWITGNNQGSKGGTLWANKESNTFKRLYLAEGFKDALNLYLSLGKEYTVCFQDSINTKFPNLDFTKFKKITYVCDSHLFVATDLNLSKLFDNIDPTTYKKIRVFNWEKFAKDMGEPLSKNIKGVSDITDFIEHLYNTDDKFKTVKNIKRNLNAVINGYLGEHTIQTLIDSKKLVSNMELLIKDYDEGKHLALFKKLKEYDPKTDLSEVTENTIKHLFEGGENIKRIELKSTISHHDADIETMLRQNNIATLSAGTGTGKSHYIINTLVDRYNNAIIVVPFRNLATQFEKESNSKIKYLDSQLETLDKLALLESNEPLVIVIDTFHTLIKAKNFKATMIERLNRCELIINDEAHSIEMDKSFRKKVANYSTLINDGFTINTKILNVSATPIYKKNTKGVIFTTPKNKKFEVETYSNEFGGDDELLIENIKERLKVGSVMFYIDRRSIAGDTERFFIDALEGVNVLRVDSTTTKLNNEKVENTSEQVAKVKTGDFIINTSSLTTGNNIPNLQTIYVYGQTYNHLSFVQLIGRFRGRNKIDGVAMQLHMLKGGGYTHTYSILHQKTYNLAMRFKSLVKKDMNHSLRKILKGSDRKSFLDGIVMNMELTGDEKEKGLDLDTKIVRNLKEQLTRLEMCGLGYFSKDTNDFNIAHKKIGDYTNEIIDNMLMKLENENAFNANLNILVSNSIKQDRYDLISQMFNLPYNLNFKSLKPLSMYLPKVTHTLLNQEQRQEKEIERNLLKHAKSDEEKALLKHFEEGVSQKVIDKLFENCTYSQLKIIKSLHSIEELKELKKTMNFKVDKIYWKLIKSLLKPSLLITEANYQLSQSNRLKVTIKDVLKGLFTSQIIPNHELTISDKSHIKGFEAFAKEILGEHFKLGRLGKSGLTSIQLFETDIKAFKVFTKAYNELELNNPLDRIERMNLLKYKAHSSKQYLVKLVIEKSLEESLTTWDEPQTITPRLNKVLKDIESIKSLEIKHGLEIEGYANIDTSKPKYLLSKNNMASLNLKELHRELEGDYVPIEWFSIGA